MGGERGGEGMTERYNVGEKVRDKERNEIKGREMTQWGMTWERIERKVKRGMAKLKKRNECRG